MNFQQARQVLSYLWSTHPSAPRIDDNDKARIITSFFRVLYRYSLEDVMDAVDKACRKTPSFLPSAYEIESCCTKRPNVDAFLPQEYFELDSRYKEYEGCYFNELCRARAARALAQNDDEREQCDTRIDGIIERINIETQMHDIYERAYVAALEEYERKQAEMASEDLRFLGFEQLAKSLSER